jgi:hypothetical protein
MISLTTISVMRSISSLAGAAVLAEFDARVAGHDVG